MVRKFFELSEHAITSLLDAIKVWVGPAKDFATIFALFLAAWWFREQRSTNANIKLDQSVSWQRAVGTVEDEHTLLVAFDVRATNIGKVKVDLNEGLFQVIQINPQPEQVTILKEFRLAAEELEPGEGAQVGFYVVPVHDAVHSIQIRSCYEVPKSSTTSVSCKDRYAKGDKPLENRYWNLLSIAEVGSEPVRQQTATSVH